MNTLNTAYAPAERIDKEVLLPLTEEIKKDELINRIMESLPFVSAIINEERQFLFVNKALLSLSKEIPLEEMVGKRLGEAVHCIHASKNEAGCGTSEDCRYCGAVNSILKSQKLKDKVSEECRITSKTEQGFSSYDFNVTCNPINIKDHTYTFVVIEDISDTKRKQNLERIFFHDVLNKAGSMDGLIEIIQQTEDLQEVNSMLAIVQSVTHDLVGEIQFQRDLVSAENGEYQLDLKEIDPRVILSVTAEQIRHHTVSKGKKVNTLIASETRSIKSDQVLLSRVLTNMLKNSLEATAVGGEVNAMVYDGTGCVGFCIQNSGVMSAKVKSQVFQRSFSTKGKNRGLGTYSIKMLTEKYLGGKAFFTSSEGDGTQFFIEIPI